MTIGSLKQPSVCVITLNWNTKMDTSECVESLKNLNYNHFEIVVIDNGSTDGSIDFFERKYHGNIKIISSKTNLGYSRGFNLGLEYAVQRGFDYVLVLNSDTVIDIEALKYLVKAAEDDPKIGFVTGKVYFSNFNGRSDVLQTVGKKTHPIKLVGDHIGFGEIDNGQYDEISERDFVDDVFLLVRKELIIKTGGYNQNFFLQWEEADWQARGKNLGYKVIFTPHAKIWHKVSIATGGTDSPLRYYYSTRNAIIFVRRNGTEKQFGLYIILLTFYWFPLTSFSNLSKARVDLLVARLKGLFSGLIWITKHNKKGIS